MLDLTTEAGGEASIEQLAVAQRHDQTSTARIRLSAPSARRLDLIVNRLMPLGARPTAPPRDARLQEVAQRGVAPADFYSTTIYPTDVRIAGQWVRAAGQRMDAVIVVQLDPSRPPVARCRLLRDLEPGQQVVCGVDGVRIHRPLVQKGEGEFAFMSAGVSTERRVELAVEQLAWEMKRIKARNGRIVFVVGPVVIHTGGGKYLGQIIRGGFVQALLTGNAMPAHDIELNLYGTSLGVDLARGVGVHGGHQHHIRAINRVRQAGSIKEAVDQGIITDGVMYECAKNDVQYVLAGSIRDDGPLPDTLMDLGQAQAAYARAIEEADMIVMLSSMLHAIGTGNMTPAGVRLVCVDISPAVVTKLADRGSVESMGIVTDVGLFLNLLAHQLGDE
jgi:lysine-ketoglutarate reductase/saccharopine dehydrogenase-like protein (TIGR00300 family)